MRMPNPRAAFQDKVVGGGERLPRGRGRKEGYKGCSRRGGNQPGHGGGARSPALGSRWRPRAPGSPGLLGLRSAGNGPESAGGRLQPPPAGAGAGDHLATRCHHVRLRLPLPLPVPALPGAPLHGASAGPRLHRPAGHWIPAAGAAAGAGPGHLPPPLPAPPPGRLPCALQPSPVPAPAHPTAEADPGLTRVPGCSHTGEGLGLRRVESSILSPEDLQEAQGCSAQPCSSPLPESGPSISSVERQHLWTQGNILVPQKTHPHLNPDRLGWTLHISPSSSVNS